MALVSLPILLFDPAGFGLVGALLVTVVVGLQWKHQSAMAMS